MKNITLEQAKIIARKRGEANLEKAQQILMDYLTDDPQDTKAWLLLALTESKPPFEDPERIIHYVQHILSYDSSNPYALLFWSYADHFLKGDVDDELYEKLVLTKSDNIQIMAMIEIAKARYFKQRDPKKAVEALKKSIKYDPTIVSNYYMLGELFIDQGNINEGKQLIKFGLDNVKRIITPENAGEEDSMSMTNFLNEFFTGTTMNFVKYACLQELMSVNDTVVEN